MTMQKIIRSSLERILRKSISLFKTTLHLMTSRNIIHFIIEYLDKLYKGIDNDYYST